LSSEPGSWWDKTMSIIKRINLLVTGTLIEMMLAIGLGWGRLSPTTLGSSIC